jgi:hypothetical protein
LLLTLLLVDLAAEFKVGVEGSHGEEAQEAAGQGFAAFRAAGQEGFLARKPGLEGGREGGREGRGERREGGRAR